MFLKIAVVDDVGEDIVTVKNMTRRFFSQSNHFEPVIKAFPSARDFLRDFANEDFDLVFLDICMDDMNGLELSRRIRSADKEIAIIFMSTTTEFVFETFRAVPHGYLRKPFSFEDFSEATAGAVEKFSYELHKITVKVPRKEETIDAENIVFVTADHHAVQIKMATGHTMRGISAYSEMAGQLLSQDGFMECNRGILINTRHILSQNGSDVTMSDGTVFPVRRQDRKTVSEILIKNLSRKMKGGFIP